MNPSNLSLLSIRPLIPLLFHNNIITIICLLPANITTNRRSTLTAFPASFALWLACGCFFWFFDEALLVEHHLFLIIENNKLYHLSLIHWKKCDNDHNLYILNYI